MGFGAQLRTAREQVGLSQQDLADKAGISVDSIQNWEQGRTRPRLSALGKLAQALGVSLDMLVIGAEKKPEPRRGRGRPRKADAAADAGSAEGETPSAKKKDKRKK